MRQIARNLKNAFGFAIIHAIYNGSRTVYYGTETSSWYYDGFIFTQITMYLSPLAFVLFAYLASRNPAFSQWLLRIVAFSVPLGLVLWWIQSELLVGAEFFLALAISAFLLAVGLSAGLLCWVTKIADEKQPSLIQIASFELSLWGLFVFLFHSISFTYRVWVMLLFFIISLFLLFSKRERHSTENSQHHIIPTSEKYGLYSVMSALWKPIVYMSALGFSSGAVRIVKAVSHINPNLHMMLTVCAFIAAAAFFLIQTKTRSGVNFVSIYLLSLLVSATACILYPFVVPETQMVLLGIVDTVFLLGTMFMWVDSVRASKNNSYSPISTMGLYAGVVYFFVALGFSVGNSFGHNKDIHGALIVSLSVVYLFIVAAVIITVQIKKKKTPGEITTALSISIRVLENDVRQNKTLVNKYQLTEREIDVILLVLGGRTAGDIAETLYISENTVKTHLKKIYKKLDVHNKKEMIKLVEKAVFLEED